VLSSIPHSRSGFAAVTPTPAAAAIEQRAQACRGAFSARAAWPPSAGMRQWPLGRGAAQQLRKTFLPVRQVLGKRNVTVIDTAYADSAAGRAAASIPAHPGTVTRLDLQGNVPFRTQ